MKFLFKKLINHYIVKNVLYAIGLTVLLLLTVFISLNVYTNHGESMAVPDLTGLQPDEVRVILNAKNLEFEIQDSIYENSVAPGAVVSQYPSAGFKVKENRTVFLTTNATQPEMVTMPNVVGLSLRQATAILETNGLKVGKLTYVPDIAINNVLYQKKNGVEVMSGAKLKKNSDVELVLGKGISNERTLMPDLIGLTMEKAQEKIITSSLNPGAVVYDETIVTEEDTLNAMVWQQSPGFNNDYPVNLGTSVDVWLTLNEELLPAAVDAEQFP